MKEVYLVKWSNGEYDDYTEQDTETVFISLLSAEKAKKEIEDYHKIEYPFPFEGDELNFDWERASNADYEKYIKWRDRRNENYSFNRAWIATLTLEQE